MSVFNVQLGTPGSLLWLLRWEARLRVRELAAGRSVRQALVIASVLAVLAHALLYFLMWTIAQRAPQDPQAYRPVVVMLGGVVLMIAMMQGLNLTLRAVFEARELSLALISPLPLSRILHARVVSVVLATAASPALMLLPIANCGAALGQPHWLLLYPLTLAVAAWGVACALLLIRPVLHFASPRSARRLLQTLQFAVPVVFVLWNASHPSSHDGDATHLPASLLWLSGAAYGHAAPLVLALLLPVGLLVLGCWRMEAAVRRVLLEAEPALLWRQHMPPIRAFRGGLIRSVMLKEWRCVLRDSRRMVSLLGQPLMLAVAFLPVLLRMQDRTAASAALAVYVIGQLSQQLCSATLNAELAPTLLDTAPVPRSRLLQAKLLAALLPVWIFAAMVTAVIALRSLPDAGIAVLGMLGSSISIGAFVLLRPRRLERRSFLGTQSLQRISVVDMLGVLILELGWALGTYGLCINPTLAVILMIIVIVMLMVTTLASSPGISLFSSFVRRSTTNQ